MIRVYLIFQTIMFRDAVKAILSDHSEITLVGVRQDDSQIADDLVALEPDVILLEENATGSLVAGVHSLLTSPIPCRLITMRLDADGMHVWSQTWHHTVARENLVQAIITAKDVGKGAYGA